MKKLICCIALIGLVGLTACTSDSPTAPSNVPTVVPDEWSISAVSVYPSSAIIGTQVTVTALVFQNGITAPDGTDVEFSATGGSFPDGQVQETVNGRATVTFTADEAGTYSIRAQVETATKSGSVTYTEQGGPGGDELQIFQLIPNMGSTAGGEQVIVEGKGIATPAEVDFVLDTGVFQAIVTDVEPSEPASATGRIYVLTPANVNFDQDFIANIEVRVGVGTSNQQQTNFPNGFTFDPGAGGVPMLYGLDPQAGPAQGGQTVTIFGRDLTNATRVSWIGDQIDLLSPEFDVSQDGSQIFAVTPRFSLGPLEEDVPVAVEVSTPAGDVRLNNAYLVLADEPQPEITSIAPAAGPLDGGTQVTIFGHGFQQPVQVFFGTAPNRLEAEVVTVIDDPGLADNDQIICITPDFSQEGITPPFTAQVEVVNSATGKFAVYVGFTFGDQLFISGNSPTEGRPGDNVQIYGSGFEDPLQVRFLGGNPDIDLDVHSVSGTEIAARFPTDIAPNCDPRPGSFRVTLIESNRSIDGGNFTILGNTPTVISVEPTFVQETNFGNGVDPDDITISGDDFADDLLVSINNFVMSTASVTVISENNIEVENIPAPNDFGLVFETTSCVTNDGLQGVRNAPTAVDVTVTNLPGNCADTLRGALIYEPEDTTCVATAELVLQPSAAGYPPTPLGGCAPFDFTVFNNGGGELQVYQMNLIGEFYFDGSASNQVSPGFAVPAFSTSSPFTVWYCPQEDRVDGSDHVGRLTIQNSSPNNPVEANLVGTDPFPEWLLSASSFDFGDVPAGGGLVTQPLQIGNYGTGTLHWTLTGFDATVFLRDNVGAVSGGTILPGGVADLFVAFNPSSGATGTINVTLTITADEQDANPLFENIQVIGNITGP